MFKCSMISVLTYKMGLQLHTSVVVSYFSFLIVYFISLTIESTMCPHSGNKRVEKKVIFQHFIDSNVLQPFLSHSAKPFVI